MLKRKFRVGPNSTYLNESDLDVGLIEGRRMSRLNALCDIMCDVMVAMVIVHDVSKYVTAAILIYPANKITQHLHSFFVVQW